MCCPVPSGVWRKSHTRGEVGSNVLLAVGLGLGEGDTFQCVFVGDPLPGGLAELPSGGWLETDHHLDGEGEGGGLPGRDNGAGFTDDQGGVTHVGVVPG